jgi:tetratricopeptide (TPR) repeat protein
MSLELNLRFAGADRVEVRLAGDDSGSLEFSNPLTESDRDDMRWYLETYGARSIGDPDDDQATRVRKKLPRIGKALFDAVFSDRAAQRLFNDFQDSDGTDRQLTISADHADLLSLPWELLHDSATGGAFLFREHPAVSIRRRLPGATGGRTSYTVKSKDTLRLLFVVSRPEESGFLDPRADPQAVMDALDAEAPGRVECEFLRPATIDALNDRLSNESLPPADIVHFDGHGVFDADGRIADSQRKNEVGDRDDVRDRTREAGGDDDSDPAGMGYLLFEDADGKRDLVSAELFAQNLHRRKVALVILSACQSAMVEGQADPLAMVAARLTAAGIPAVLAMTYSVLVHTTRTLFGEFYRHLARGRRMGESLDQARACLQNHPQKYEVQRGQQRQMLELHDWFVPVLYQSGDDVPLLNQYDAQPIPVMGGDRAVRVFLSHSSADKPVARRLAESLRVHGIDVWIDEGEIKVGDPIGRKIDKGLRDCDFLVALLSRNSVESEWVQREISSRLHADAATGSHSILPVRLDDCDVPPLLADLLHADLSQNREAAVSALVNAIRQNRRPEQAPRSSGSEITNDAETNSPPEQRGARSGLQETATGQLRPQHEAGFFGRRRELWDIECWFAGPTQRISMSGFGGQGKTELALEAGRWLTRIGLFQRAVFVDYSRIQAAAPESVVRVAVSHIGSVLDQTLASPDEATAALAGTPTLVILDNLEALARESLQALLDAATGWSQAGGSRVLLTSRLPEFPVAGASSPSSTIDHPDYRNEGTLKHRHITLSGLGSRPAPDDALEWFKALSHLPPMPAADIPRPTREELIDLFEQVRFHPLSISVLSQQLKTRQASELGQRLEQLLSDDSERGAGFQPARDVQETAGFKPAPQDDTPPSLLASLQLSLDRLSDAERHAVRALGVFRGGAMEPDLLAITGLGESDVDAQREKLQAIVTAIESRDARTVLPLLGSEISADAEIPEEVLAQIPWDELQADVAQLQQQLAEIPESTGENVWPSLRKQLERAALIEPEHVPGVGPPFLRFHPTLAPLLWSQLDAGEQSGLTDAHWRRYYQLSGYIFNEDHNNPHEARAIAWRELPNLLHAVHIALDAADPDAVEFVTKVNRFLTFFGLAREAERLTGRAEAIARDTSSQAWFLAQSNRGDQLLASGQVAAAAEVFTSILSTLGDQPTFERTVTLGRLGRCYTARGRPDLAEASHREGLEVTDHLDQTDTVKRTRGTHHKDLADVLRDQGRFAEAREQYQTALRVFEELDEVRSRGAILGQLGALAMAEGNLADAQTRYRDALTLFQHLREPTSEAVIWHQLGIVFKEAGDWDESERHFRESARLEETNGNLAGAAQTWNNLAAVSLFAGRSDAAETWFRKAIKVNRALASSIELASNLNNLAVLLQSQPQRLSEARELAEEALAIKKTLDPGAAQIWTTYHILSEIADQQSRGDEASEYRRQAREAKRDFPGTRHKLRQRAQLIIATVAACSGDEQAAELVTAHQEQMRQVDPDWTRCANALDRVLSGDRDPDALCDGLDYDTAMIIEAILAGLSDPSSLSDLLPTDD